MSLYGYPRVFQHKLYATGAPHDVGRIEELIAARLPTVVEIAGRDGVGIQRKRFTVPRDFELQKYTSTGAFLEEMTGMIIAETETALGLKERK